MKHIGSIGYYLARPFLRLVLKSTERAYVLVTVDDKCLMVKPWLGRDLWLLPGGGLKSGETAAQAASRELAYETGLQINQTDFKKIASGVWQTDKLGFNYTVFQVKIDATVAVRRRLPEIWATQWRPVSDLNRGNCPVEILTIIKP